MKRDRRSPLREIWVGMSVMVVLAGGMGAAAINPYPRPILQVETLQVWEFAESVEDWQAAHDCTIAPEGGAMVITSTGNDPYLYSPELSVRGRLLVRLRMKHTNQGGGQLFYVTEKKPTWSEAQSVRFLLASGTDWEDYDVALPATGLIKRVRLDPGYMPGRIEVDRIELVRTVYHPLELEAVSVNPPGGEIHLQLQNHADQVVSFSCVGRKGAVGGGERISMNIHLGGREALKVYPLEVQVKDYPPLQRTLFVYRPEGTADWVTLRSDKVTLRAARDGSVAELEADGRVVAALAPLVHVKGQIPSFQMTKEEDRLHFQGEGIEVGLELAGDEVSVQIQSERDCEGPVVRVQGPLEQGLLSGLEYLGEGEASSSTLDIESAEHVRYTPDVDQVTMPLMSFVTSGSETTAGETATWTGVSLLWEDMELQPVFATPNFFEGGPDHRMALRGKTIRATIHVGSGPLEEEILWAVRKRALPAPPKAPRDWPEQKALCLAALNGPLKTEEGWGHCVGPRWPHRPFADQASTLWRLTGEVPPLEKIDMGGSHIPNDAIFFVTGRAKQWRDYWRNVSKGILNSQQQEGSFRYKGKYLKGHFEDTASGFCAQKAKVLLEYAWLTGDMEALVGGVKTLESMKRFRTPRGAQTWELSLHTPDILASAYLVWAYVRGYQLTGEADYLEQARRWALTGLPFVYQWGRYPVMVYSTTAVYGATNWVAPNWMGLPVQWCGTVYAYGLLLLAEHDRTVDWRRVAEGILTAAEQMQYTEGNVGCLPDSFHLKGQRRNPADINPCALVSLRRRLAGEIDSLAVGTDGIHRVTAPFPVMVEDDRAMIQGQAGLTYQILIDGERIVEITSQGRDVVSLIEGAPESKDN